jgi:hypothetical protein
MKSKQTSLFINYSLFLYTLKISYSFVFGSFNKVV